MKNDKLITIYVFFLKINSKLSIEIDQNRSINIVFNFFLKREEEICCERKWSKLIRNEFTKINVFQ